MKYSNYNNQLRKWKNFWNSMGTKKNIYAQINRDPIDVDREAEYIRKIANTIGVKKNSVLLDLCCGNGLITQKISKRFKYVYGIDFSERLIKQAKRNASNLKINNVSYILARADEIQSIMKNDSVDFAYCLTSFHYFPSYKYALRTITSVLGCLKRGGSFLITDIPNKECIWYSIWNLIRNKKGKRDKNIEKINLQPTTSFFHRVILRAKLLFRKFTNINAESDYWLWYSPSFFMNLKALDMETSKVKIFPSRKKRKILNYRFDVIITKK